MEVKKDGRYNMITIDGVTKTLGTWAKEFGVHEHTVWYRVEAGWPQELWFLAAHGRGRPTQNAEQKKRGCFYCADFQNRVCIHEACPYHELDGFKNYNEYLKKAGKNGLVKMLEELG